MRVTLVTALLAAQLVAGSNLVARHGDDPSEAAPAASAPGTSGGLFGGSGGLSGLLAGELPKLALPTGMAEEVQHLKTGMKDIHDGLGELKQAMPAGGLHLPNITLPSSLGKLANLFGGGAAAAAGKSEATATAAPLAGDTNNGLLPAAPSMGAMANMGGGDTAALGAPAAASGAAAAASGAASAAAGAADAASAAAAPTGASPDVTVPSAAASGADTAELASASSGTEAPEAHASSEPEAFTGAASSLARVSSLALGAVVVVAGWML